MASLQGNKKIAKKRGAKWKKNLVKGRLKSLSKITKLYLKRSSTGLSQSNFAKQVKISAGTYGEIERAKRQVKHEIGEKISAKLETSFQCIFKKSEKGKFVAIRVNT